MSDAYPWDANRLSELNGLSDLIGEIYDCAIDPDGWVAVLSQITALLEASTSAVDHIDLDRMEPRQIAQWGMPQEAAWQWQTDYAVDVAELLATVVKRAGPDPDEPPVYSRLFTPSERAASRIDREWAAPQGVCGVVSAVVSTSPERIGCLAANRHESAGLVTPREMAIMRLLIPHVRQAIAIGDLLDMRRLTSASLKATLDTLTCGVVIVGDDAKILHANSLARSMMADGGPLRSTDGALHLGTGRIETGQGTEHGKASAAALHLALSERSPPPNRIAIAASTPGSPRSVIAHILPVDTGPVRNRLAPAARAAVIVAGGAAHGHRLLDTLASTWNLSAAERKVLAPIARGLGVKAAAEEIGVSVNTVKTHLVNLFKKAGVSRQADLAALVQRAVPQISVPPERPLSD